jgi:hypothetical protein
VGDRTNPSRGVSIQRGTVNPAAHTITWAASDSALDVSGSTKGNKPSFISKDVNGYLWIVSQNKTSASTYDLSVFRSASTDSVTSWVHSVNLITPDSNGANVRGSIVPAGSGSNMWAVYSYGGDMAVRKYTGTWSTETVLYDNTGTDFTNTEYGTPCVVVDTRGKAHVVYGDGNVDAGTLKPHIYYTYNNTASGWASSVALSSTTSTLGFRFPTIALDSSTNNVYAFWVNMSSDNGIAAVKKLSSSSTWTTISLGPQLTYAKSYLTSIYSVSGESRICFQWTQNTTAPYEVWYDRIPEFTDAFVPVLFVILVFAVGYRRRSGNRKDREI